MGTTKKKNSEESISAFIFYYIKEIISAFLLIGFGLVLYAYADDIGAWFGEMVQNGFNELLRMMGYESPA